MLTVDSTSSYEASEGRYNWNVHEFTIGDVIRKARTARRWSQTKLGKEAARFQFGAETTPINKSTVSKVEKDPYSSEFGTVWRLLTALNLKFAEVERRVGHPFVETIRDTGVPGLHTGSAATDKTLKKSHGRLLAESVRHADQVDPVSGASRASVRRAATDLLRVEGETERAADVDQSTRSARAVGQHAAAPPTPKPGHRAVPRKRRR
jgi:transcriptional regulator with XRE-family HTH domain